MKFAPTMRALVALFFSSFCAIAWSATPNIRILTAYNTAAATGAQDQYGVTIEQLIDIEIGRVNSALSNSAATFRVESAGTVSVPKVTGNLASEILYQAQRDFSLLVAKDNLLADVVVVLFDSVYIGGAAERGSVVTTPAVATTPFAAVQVVGMQSLYTYEHEFGHLVGAKHQSAGGVLANDTSSNNGGHGYYLRVRNKTVGFTNLVLCYHTIMAYTPVDNLQPECNWNGDTDSTQIAHYSNPNVAIQGFSGPLNSDMPTGSSSANNVYVMNYTAATVAKFRNTKLSLKRKGIIATIVGMLQLD